MNWSTVLSNRARTALARGDFPRAEEWFREGLAIEIQAGDRRAEAWSRMNLATIRIELGELGDAPAQLECALSLHRALSSQRGESFVLTNQGVLALIEDRPSDARTLLRDALGYGDRRDAPRLGHHLARYMGRGRA